MKNKSSKKKLNFKNHLVYVLEICIHFFDTCLCKLFYTCFLFWLFLFSHAFAGFIGEGVGFSDRECLVWYMLFIIFVPYAMLPLPLKWCMIAGTVSATEHLIVISIVKVQKNSVSICVSRNCSK